MKSYFWCWLFGLLLLQEYSPAQNYGDYTQPYTADEKTAYLFDFNADGGKPGYVPNLGPSQWGGWAQSVLHDAGSRRFSDDVPAPGFGKSLYLSGGDGSAQNNPRVELQANGTAPLGQRTLLDTYEDLSTALTVEAWIRPDRVTGTQRIVSRTHSYFLYLVGDEVAFWVDFADGKDSLENATELRAAGIKVVPGQWTHVAGQFDGQGLSIWINGKRVGTGNVLNQPRLRKPLPQDWLVLGAAPWPGENFKGEIDEVRISLSKRFPPPAPEPRLLYNGITLPALWPPRDMDPATSAPQAVPYLRHPPAVIPIDVGRQLFVDDFLVSRTTLTREFHLAKKYEGNPVLKPATKAEQRHEKAAAAPLSGGVWYDPGDKLFKMWYTASFDSGLAYATSKDALHWQRPELDIIPGTNLVQPPPVANYNVASTAVILDHWTADPLQRFKLYESAWDYRGTGTPKMRSFVATSADGIHWSQPYPNRLVPDDRTTIFYNPFRSKWVYSLRCGAQRGRAREYREHQDFLVGADWTEEEKVYWTGADCLDLPDPEIKEPAQLYNLDAVAYESIMLGAFSIHLGPRNEVCEAGKFPKITEIKLGFSRDGFHWDRPDRRAFIAATRKPGSWERGYVMSAANVCLVMNDTLYFHYSGFLGGNSMYGEAGTGVAMLRRDGFASMNAEDQPGELITRPVTFRGQQLFVNLDAPRGELTVEVLNANGQPLEPYTFANCMPVKGDNTLQSVTWRGVDSLKPLSGKPVRFRFRLTHGKLYAFWVSPSTNGESMGYVAGGGPGYDGPIDTRGRTARQGADKH
jgi:hypothetical protein